PSCSASSRAVRSPPFPGGPEERRLCHSALLGSAHPVDGRAQFLVSLRPSLLLAFLLVQNRQQSRPVFAQLTDLLQRFALSHRPLKAQLEDLLTHFGFLTLELVGRHVAKFPRAVRGLHASPLLSSRLTHFR